ILPVGIFCCAVMMDINFRKRKIKIWNGGLPDCFVRRRGNGAIEPVKSTHLPLGVLSNRAFKDNCEYLDLDIDDRIYVWSDGIHEARNASGEMFGEARLKKVFEENQNPTVLFDEIIESVQHFVGGGEKDDDLSLLEIRMDEPAGVNAFAKEASDRYGNADTKWAMHFEVKPTSFKVFDPLPMLLNVLMEVPSLRAFSSTIYTILAELYTNALEHGVLGLDSALKTTAEGFAEYYRLREERINAVSEGFVHIYIKHKTNADGGLLRVRIEDSGTGFDFS